MNAADTLPVLENPCSDCEGGGRTLYDPELLEWRDCEKCRGTGFILTPNGETVIRLLRHHSRVKVELAYAEA